MQDEHGRLRVGAAIGTSLRDLDRAAELLAAGCDVLVIDTARSFGGRAEGSGEDARALPGRADHRRERDTAEGARALMERGPARSKSGSVGSICTTRVVTGVGVPTHGDHGGGARSGGGSRVIADGGIHSGDLVKALAAGAHAAMMGLAPGGDGREPGESFLLEGRRYKTVRGMGSLSAMEDGSADRYFQEGQEARKFVPEGIEGRSPVQGPVADVIYQLVGGLRSGMGYCGCRDLEELRTKARFVRITGGGLRESHPHNVTITREAPNYHMWRRCRGAALAPASGGIM